MILIRFGLVNVADLIDVYEVIVVCKHYRKMYLMVLLLVLGKASAC